MESIRNKLYMYWLAWRWINFEFTLGIEGCPNTLTLKIKTIEKEGGYG